MNLKMFQLNNYIQSISLNLLMSFSVYIRMRENMYLCHHQGASETENKFVEPANESPLTASDRQVYLAKNS